MEVILLEKIRNLGSLGDKVKVKSGYGRNYLVPQGKAVYATDANIKKFELRRAELEKHAAEVLKLAEDRRDAIQKLQSITITAKAGEEGKLFGSIGTRDIAIAIANSGVEVTKSEVILPMGVLRQVGVYEIEIELHGDVNAKIQVNIIGES